MSEWISVNALLPVARKPTKFRVKAMVGSMQPKEQELTVMGKTYPSGFRFSVGDWTRVTHWKPLPLEGE